MCERYNADNSHDCYIQWEKSSTQLSILVSISSTSFVHIFHTKFWRQKLQSWLLGLKFWRQKFCTKNACVSVDEIDTLLHNIERCDNYFQTESSFNGPNLISRWLMASTRFCLMVSPEVLRNNFCFLLLMPFIVNYWSAFPLDSVQ